MNCTKYRMPEHDYAPIEIFHHGIGYVPASIPEYVAIIRELLGKIEIQDCNPDENNSPKG